MENTNSGTLEETSPARSKKGKEEPNSVSGLKVYERKEKRKMPRHEPSQESKKSRVMQTDANSTTSQESQEFMDMERDSTRTLPCGPSTSTRIHPPDMYYKMNHKNRGVAVIFNQGSFEAKHNTKDRKGTDYDCDALVSLLQELGFMVSVYHDSLQKDVIATLKKVSSQNHSNHDCLVVIVLTHGSRGGVLYARDETYTRKDLWTPFTADACPTLAGKPKLFFLQACQGSSEMGSVPKRVMETDSHQIFRDRIPSHADFLFVCSTMRGFVSYRHPITGSVFIWILVQEMREKAYRFDLGSILTYVNKRVAEEFQTPSDEDKNRYVKQMPCYENMLTKFVHFEMPINSSPRDRVACGKDFVPGNIDEVEDVPSWTAISIEQLLREDPAKLQRVVEVEIVNAPSRVKAFKSLEGLMPKLQRLVIRGTGKGELEYPKHQISPAESKARWLELQDIALDYVKVLIKKHGRYLQEIRLWVDNYKKKKKRKPYPWISPGVTGLNKLLKECCFRQGTIVLRSFYLHKEGDCRKALEIDRFYGKEKYPVEITIVCEIYGRKSTGSAETECLYSHSFSTNSDSKASR